MEDEEFDLDGMSFNPDLVQTCWEALIKRNPDADNVIRAAHTGESRATKYRRLGEARAPSFGCQL